MKTEDALMSQLLVLQAAFRSLEEEMFCMGYDQEGNRIPDNIERQIKLGNAWSNITDTIDLLKMTPAKRKI